MNYNKVEKINPDTATTLCARDYKGFGTGFNTMNGVIECEMLDKERINMKEMIENLKGLYEKMLHNSEMEDLVTDEEVAAVKECIRMLEDGDYR